MGCMDYNIAIKKVSRLTQEGTNIRSTDHSQAIII